MTDICFQRFLILWNQQQGQSTPDIHLKLSSWIEQKWRGGQKRLLVMAFRGFGKSSILGVFCSWLLYLNQDLRILILAADLALATKMVRQVKRIIEKHPATSGLKPDRVDQWGKECFTVRRNCELRDPSMLAKGIDTNLTGTRAEIIICDDVEVPRTCNTAYKRAELRERLAELDYIQTPEGMTIYIGTPHCWETIYAEDKRQGEESIFLDGFERYVVPVMDEENASVWPERFSQEKLEKMVETHGPAHFESQMMCRPSNLTDGKYDPGDIDVYHGEIEYSETGRRPVLTIDGVRMVSGIAWWDPAFGKETGDRSVIAVVYKGENEHHYIHCIKQIFVKSGTSISEMEQQCGQVAKVLEDNHVPTIVVETNGIGGLIPGHLRCFLRERQIGCHIEEVHSKEAKNLRIRRGFEAPMAAKTLHAHRRARANSLITQLQDWNPNKKNQQDDVLDAVAGAISRQGIKFPAANFSKRQNWQKGGQMHKAKTIMD